MLRARKIRHVSTMLIVLREEDATKKNKKTFFRRTPALRPTSVLYNNRVNGRFDP